MFNKIADGIADLILSSGQKDITKPMFVKEFHRNDEELEKLTIMANTIKDKTRKRQIELDVVFLRQGSLGEANVAFELKNSLIPMLCMHDVRIEYDGYTAQMDFVIITRSFIMVLETKKLVGDIEINSDGDFIRIFKNRFGKVVKKEGIYSPISQNQRQVRILDKLLKDYKMIKNAPVKSLVVLANPKTILNKKYAPKQIQNNIFKYDQLSTVIEKENKNKDSSVYVNLSDKKMTEIADLILKYHQPKSFLDKYELDISETTPEKVLIKETTDKLSNLKEDVSTLEDVLRFYRLETSRAEGSKAFMVFTNKQMLDITKYKPTSKAELLHIKGFGEVKVAKYGESIIKIVNNFNKLN